ncbi:helix-turn-helix domain-containing protein [Paenibacillus puldeungensis]|uniref:Helix-turn-helix domain-containing protein n=1 Tax=Paenibacillus puldeungensis TaxID=696536 RepID=A0ABW3RXM5_9BACL
MSDLGQQLREARLARGLSLDDIQEMTKIRKRYLEAIESGDYKVLPGSFYVRAFIKTYAEAVGVDAEELLAEHRPNVPETEPEQTMEPVMQKRRSRQHSERNSKWLSTTLMWSFAVLILAVIYMYFTVWGKSETADNKQPDPTPVTQEAQKGGQAPSGDNAGKTPDSTPAGNTGDATGDPANGGTKTDATNGTGTDATDKEGQPAAGSITVVPDGKEGSATKFKVQNAGTQTVQAVITASGKSWVEVRKGGRTGEKLYYANMEDGDVQTYDVGPEGLYIKSGNSKNTVITVAGQTVDDGKTTSKLLINLDNGSTGTDPNQTGNTGTDGAGTPDGTGTGTNTGTDTGNQTGGE